MEISKRKKSRFIKSWKGKRSEHFSAVMALAFVDNQFFAFLVEGIQIALFVQLSFHSFLYFDFAALRFHNSSTELCPSFDGTFPP